MADAGFVQSGSVGLMVSALGQRSPSVTYPLGGREGIFLSAVGEWARAAVGARFASHCLGLEPRKNVAAHCLNSFHRGPVALAAILKRLFGFQPRRVLQLPARRRSMWFFYRNDRDGILGNLGQAVEWADGLSLWQPLSRPPPPTRPSAPSQGQASSSRDVPFRSLQEAGQLLKVDEGKFLYRAMLPDKSDLATPHPASRQDLRGAEIVNAIFDAVVVGSTVRSPFCTSHGTS